MTYPGCVNSISLQIHYFALCFDYCSAGTSFPSIKDDVWSWIYIVTNFRDDPSIYVATYPSSFWQETFKEFFNQIEICL